MAPPAGRIARRCGTEDRIDGALGRCSIGRTPRTPLKRRPQRRTAALRSGSGTPSLPPAVTSTLAPRTAQEDFWRSEKPASLDQIRTQKLGFEFGDVLPK